MTVDNGSFEDFDPATETSGTATGWTVTASASLKEVAEFQGDPPESRGYEDFQEGWAAYAFIDAFEGLIIDLDPSVFEGGLFQEGFEINWGVTISELVGLPADFDGNDFEAFGEGWGGIFLDSLPPQTTALFDAESFEDFEEGWGTFVTTLPPQTTAVFVGPDNFEDFEGTWTAMVTI